MSLKFYKDLNTLYPTWHVCDTDTDRNDKTIGTIYISLPEEGLPIYFRLDAHWCDLSIADLSQIAINMEKMRQVYVLNGGADGRNKEK